MTVLYEYSEYVNYLFNVFAVVSGAEPNVLLKAWYAFSTRNHLPYRFKAWLRGGGQLNKIVLHISRYHDGPGIISVQQVKKLYNIIWTGRGTAE